MDFISVIFLAISSSIDAFGLGITYGLRKIKLSFFMNCVLFCVLFVVTLSSYIIGFLFKIIFPENIVKIIGSLILISLGIFIIFKPNQNNSFDFDKNNYIDSKEALALGLAISLDSFCIGVGVSAMGINIFVFSLFSAIFHCLFLNCSLFLGSFLVKLTSIPQHIWTEISGDLLIFIGLFKLFF